MSCLLRNKSHHTSSKSSTETYFLNQTKSTTADIFCVRPCGAPLKPCSLLPTCTYALNRRCCASGPLPMPPAAAPHAAVMRASEAAPAKQADAGDIDATTHGDCPAPPRGCTQPALAVPSFCRVWRLAPSSCFVCDQEEHDPPKSRWTATQAGALHRSTWNKPHGPTTLDTDPHRSRRPARRTGHASLIPKI